LKHVLDGAYIPTSTGGYPASVGTAAPSVARDQLPARGRAYVGGDPDLQRLQDSLELVRSTVPPGRYFQAGAYRGSRERARWPEKLRAVYTYCRIRVRGARGGLFFVDRRQLETLSGRDPHTDIPIASVFPLDADAPKRSAPPGSDPHRGAEHQI
jgi:hypothetical protein